MSREDTQGKLLLTPGPVRMTSSGSLLLKKVLRPAPPFSAVELESLQSFIRASGMTPDGAGGRAFTLDGYPYVHELYSERRAKPVPRIVIMKAARTGLTTKLLYRAAWLMANPKVQFNVALLFPNLRDVLELQATRYRPMMRSSAKYMSLISEVDRVDLVRVGSSTQRFRGMNSGAGLDSFSTDALFADEVRLMSLASIERAFVRLTSSLVNLRDNSGQVVPGLAELNSTAGFPGGDIDAYFTQSTQNYWATPCPNPSCKNHRRGIIMPLRWPDIVGRDGKRLYYQCPDCKTEIPDEVITKIGWFIERNPGAGWIGYQFSQILLGSRMLPEIWAAWNRGHNIAEVYNSRLGLPWKDPNAIPATRDIVLACKDGDAGFRWLEPIVHAPDDFIAAGLDQRAPEKHVVIYRLGRDGKYELLHLEVIEASEDAARDAFITLCLEYRVRIAVLDGEPSYDFAVGCARALEKLGIDTWLADYVDDRAQGVEFVDDRLKTSLRKASGEVKYEKRVLIDRYKAMDWALTRFKARAIRLPFDLLGKIQPRNLDGQVKAHPVANEWMLHLENIARAAIPKTVLLPDGSRVNNGQIRMIYRHLALDPHFAHANLYSMVGISRRTGTTDVFVGEGETRSVPNPVNNPIVGAGTLEDLNRAHRDAMSTSRVCGQCAFWEAPNPGTGDWGMCGWATRQGMRVSTRGVDPSCQEAFSPK